MIDNPRFPHTVEIYRASTIKYYNGGVADVSSFPYDINSNSADLPNTTPSLLGGDVDDIVTNGEPVLDSEGNEISIIDEDGNEVLVPIFTSVCGLRTVNKYADINAKVIEADYKLALPSHTFIIKIGDTLKFTNGINGQIINGTVKEGQPTNFGYNLYFNRTGT